MIVVIFEATMADDQHDGYATQSAAMREAIEGVDGFLGIERFDSATTPGKFVSLSYWRDESAVNAWRENLRHRQTQAAARAGLFANYRIVVADVLRDYGLDERQQAPN